LAARKLEKVAHSIIPFGSFSKAEEEGIKFTDMAAVVQIIIRAHDLHEVAKWHQVEFGISINTAPITKNLSHVTLLLTLIDAGDMDPPTYVDAVFLQGKSYLEAVDCALFLIVVLHVTNFVSYFVPQISSDNFQSRDLVFPLCTLTGGAENLDALQCLVDDLEGFSFDARPVHQEYRPFLVAQDRYICWLESDKKGSFLL
jgi:hypothetical protein